MKKLITYILAFGILVSTLPLQASADSSLDGDYNGSAGQGGNLQAGTWNFPLQGYRVTILNGTEPMYPENSCVDLLFSTPPPDDGNNVVNFENRLKNAEAYIKDINISQIEEIKELPYPIIGDGSSYIPNGAAVRAYLEEGRLQDGGIAGGSGGNVLDQGNEAYYPPAPPPPAPDSSEIIKEINVFTGGMKEMMSQKVVDALNMLNVYIKYYPFTALAQDEALVEPLELRAELDSYVKDCLSYFEGFVGWGQRHHELAATHLYNHRDFCYSTYRDVYNTRLEDLKPNTNKPIYGPNQYEGGDIELEVGKIELGEMSSKSKIPLADGDTSSGETNPKMNPFITACFANFHPNVLDDIIAAEDMRLLIEPIVWYRPRGTDMTIYNFYVYGTVSNIAEFNIENSIELGNENGAMMALLSNYALPNSLILSNDDTVLGLGKPGGSAGQPNVYVPSRDLIYKAN